MRSVKNNSRVWQCRPGENVHSTISHCNAPDRFNCALSVSRTINSERNFGRSLRRSNKSSRKVSSGTSGILLPQLNAKLLLNCLTRAAHAFSIAVLRRKSARQCIKFWLCGSSSAWEEPIAAYVFRICGSREGDRKRTPTDFLLVSHCSRCSRFLSRRETGVGFACLVYVSAARETLPKRPKVI